MALQVLLTVDTEFWPADPTWPHVRLPRPWIECDRAYERGIVGRTNAGDFGLLYLLETLRRHDLSAVFFVESLFASAFGASLLQRTVQSIIGARQEVQLHVHTEWLREMAVEGLPACYRQNLSDFDVDQQTAIVRHALANLRAAGALDVIAMRAGNMGGNQDTPVAAKRAGLELDFSIDPEHGPAARDALAEAQQRANAGLGCISIPLSCVETYAGRLRHAQLTALSSAEMEHALHTAALTGSDCFVIMLHSFELVHARRRNGSLRAHRVNIERWNRLCLFLAQNRNLFATVGCGMLRCEMAMPRFPRTRPIHTLRRLGEQLYSRLV